MPIGLYLANVVQREAQGNKEWDGYVERCAKSAEELPSPVDWKVLATNMRAAVEQLDACQPGSTTYVIYERGLAPIRVRDEEYLIKCRQQGFIEVPLPTLAFPTELPESLVVTAAGKSAETLFISSNQLNKCLEFYVNFPDIKFRAVTGKVIKKTLQVAGAATALASKSNTAQIIFTVIFLAATVADAVQDADLRSWDSLPSRYEVLAMPTPGDGQVGLQIGEKGPKRDIKVEPNKSNIVIVTAVNSSSMIVHHAPLQAPVAANAN